MVTKNLGELASILVAAVLLAGCASSPQSVAYRHRGIEYARPVVSPDGNYFAVDAYDLDEQRHHVDLLRLDGSGRKRIGKSSYFGDWSPDGQAAVLVESGKVSLIRLDTPRIESLETLPQGNFDGSPRFPRWLPGGKEVSYFVCTDWWLGKTCSGGNIMSQMITGGSPQIVVHDADPFLGAGPLWSPDGRRIVYRRFSEHTQCRSPDCIANIAVPIRVWSSDSRTENLLPGGIPLTWTPDGKEIWFIKSQLNGIETIAGHQIPRVSMAQIASGSADGRTTKTVVKLDEGLINLRIPNIPARNWDPSETRMAMVTYFGLVILDRSGHTISDYRETCGTGTSKQYCDVYDPNISWLPDGKSIIFVRRQLYPENREEGGGVRSGVYSLDVRTGSVTLVAADTLEMIRIK